MSLHTLLRFFPALLLAFGLIVGSVDSVSAKTKDEKKEEQKGDQEKQEEKGEPTIQRTPLGTFESLQNKVSNIQFFSTNYGIIFLNVAAGNAGGVYPRGSGKAYLFGGGIWFGAQKLWPKDPADPNSPKELQSKSVISYNPNSGRSWMAPGEVTQPYQTSRLDGSPEAVNKYRIYFSTEYDPFTGEPFDQADIQNGGSNWPIWDTDPNEDFLVDRYVGRYVSDIQQRNRKTFPKGPAVVSGEDIVSIFKDTDLTLYEIGKGRATRDGYPLGIEVDQRIYTWGFGQFQNFIFIRYSIVNKSADVLYNCYMAPALDTDIGAAGNDRMRTVIPSAAEDSLDLGVQWSETTSGDQGFGYMAADFLESPAVYPVGHPEEGFIRKDKKFYTNDEQLGLHALRNWVIDIDPRTPEERYQFMAEPTRDGDNGGGDKRFLQSTGPFNMNPGDTARIVVGVMIAPAKSNAPNGEWEDMDSLITLDLFAQKVYDENFLAPRPPDPANVSWRPLDNGVELRWDEKSERSLDFVEKGVDFAGYIIQRARKAAGSDINQYDSVVGFNIGYKTIGIIRLPTIPSGISRVVAARSRNLQALGPWWRLPMLADTNALTGINPPTALAVVQIDCFDTIKRQGGLADTVIVRRNGCLDTLYGLSFDPFDDENNDSTIFNDLSGHWWNDGSWGDQFSNKAIRDIVRDAIAEIMDSVTNGRTFIDVGDDNGDGRVDANEVDLTANEKLINNIDYYYKVLAFDGGSTEDNTPPKTNTGIAGINEVRATPEAPPAGLPITPEVISQSGLGGISNFRVIVYDQERLGQIFGGDTLEFEFLPYKLWDYDPNRPNIDNRFFSPRWYTNEVVVRSKKLGELNRFAIPLVRGDFARPVFSDRAFSQLSSANPSGGFSTFRFFNLDSTLASRFVYFNRDTTTSDGADTTVVDSLYTDLRHIVAEYRNTFVTEPGQFLFSTNGVTKSTIGVSFDWAGQQFGDSLRFGRYFSDSTMWPNRDSSILGHVIVNSNGDREFKNNFNPFDVVDGPGGGTPNTTLINGSVVYGQDQNSINLNRSTPSIGQPKIEVTFVDGGTENLVWEKDGKTYTVNGVRYIVPVVRNINSFSYDVFTTNGEQLEEEVKYNYEFPPDGDIGLRLDTAASTVLRNEEAVIRLVDLGEFAMLAYDWTSISGATPAQRRDLLSYRTNTARTPSVSPIGTPNRYYVGEYTANISDGTTTDVRFVHNLIVNGASIVVDFSGMGSTNSGLQIRDRTRRDQLVPDNPPSTDFESGDQFVVHFTGGAVGLPEPGAKVLVAIPDPTPGPGEFTDDLLDAVRVVPNPYLIDHLGQNTTGDKKIYFTRLPEQCTIEIYTAAGDLVQTIEHDASQNVDGRVAVNAWDLVSKGNRQVQTQLLVARIVTPDGAETVKKFSIVVGGFRLFTQ
ncbi:MAG: hypothetical protein KDD67_05155 [Ignavibacteriae bacterium]|nr:hypothetical protein [Ignavibacteriota bacterium]MCB9216281.1 hypothetical protein [Ignavibacteria bacterium]